MKIIIAVDDSKAARAAVDFVCEFASSDDKVFLVSVKGKIPDKSWNPFSLDVQGYLNDNNAAKQAISAIVHAHGAQLTNKGIRYKCLIDEGIDIGHVICAEADAHRADLIVVGRRHLGGIKRLVYGSESSYIIDNAPCTVLVVRPRDDKAKKLRSSQPSIPDCATDIFEPVY